MYVNVTSGQYLNARTAANSYASIAYYIPQGEEVNVIATSGKWSKVEVVGYTSKGKAWVLTSKLSNTDPGRAHNTQALSFGNKTLQTGRFGRYTKNLQLALGITVDGYFESATRTAVENYQRSNGLTIDGIAGTETLTTLWNQSGVSTTIINNGF